MKFEDFTELKNSPRAVFQELVDTFAEEEGRLINPILEEDGEYEFELVEMKEDLQLHRISIRETETFMHTLIHRLNSQYPQHDWGSLVRVAGDTKEPTIYIEYRQLEEHA